MSILNDKLNNPPYLEVAFDIPDWRRVEGIIRALPDHEAIVIEAGTPLIKKHGVRVVEKIHEIKPNSVVLADLKTLSSGKREARMAGEATADVAANLARRGFEFDAGAYTTLEERRKSLQVEVESLRAERNSSAKNIKPKSGAGCLRARVLMRLLLLMGLILLICLEDCNEKAQMGVY